jgi:methylated-DNA-[protein]-cysteine S-methyltransferase
MQLVSTHVQTPLGEMAALWGDQGLVSLVWTDRLAHVARHLDRHFGAVSARDVTEIPQLSEAISAYLGGDIRALSTLPVDPPGTPFQRTVWTSLREIPAGETWSYAELAQHIGRPRATRAVAQANGANPVPLVIPCHRVIGADGSLGGFSAGLERKRWLLSHETDAPQDSLRVHPMPTSGPDQSPSGASSR